MKLDGKTGSRAGILNPGVWMLALALTGGYGTPAPAQTSPSAAGSENPNDWPQYHRTSNA